MKKGMVVLLIVCMLISAAGCSALNEVLPSTEPTETVFSIDSYHLQITADSTFYEKTGGSFNLQITNDNAYVSIMAYAYMDLPTDVTPLDVLDMQNEDLFSKRDHVTVIEETATQSLGQKTITHGVYSAEKDGVKNYYVSYLIDLPAEETFAWVLVTAMPSYLEANRDYLDDIVCSLSTIQ